MLSKGKAKKFKKFKFGDDVIHVVDDHVYLGITFHHNDLFHKAKSKRTAHAKRDIYGLLSKIKKIGLDSGYLFRFL